MKKPVTTAVFLAVLILTYCAFTLNAGAEYEPFRMEKGASVRLSAGGGIRFTAGICKEYYNGLCAPADVVSVTRGMLIIPAAYLDKTGNVFTREALEAAGLKYLDVVSHGWYKETETSYIISGGVRDIRTENYLLEYTGIAYIELTLTDGVRTVYAARNGRDNIRSPYSVALAALCDGEKGASMYIDGVADIRLAGGCRIRTNDEALSGIEGIDGSKYINPYSCRCDGGTNIFVTSSDGSLPDRLYVDGKLAAYRVNGGYSASGNTFCVSTVSGGVLLSPVKSSRFSGIEDNGYTVSDSGFPVSAGVEIDKTVLFSGDSVSDSGFMPGGFAACCFDGSSIYYIQNEASGSSASLIKAPLYDSTANTLICRLGFAVYGGMTYNALTDELIIAQGGISYNVTVLDAATLETKRTVSAGAPHSGCYFDAYRNSYLFGPVNGRDYTEYNSDFSRTALKFRYNSMLACSSLCVDGEDICIMLRDCITDNGAFLLVLDENGCVNGIIDLNTAFGIGQKPICCFTTADGSFCAACETVDGLTVYKLNFDIE